MEIKKSSTSLPKEMNKIDFKKFKTKNVKTGDVSWVKEFRELIGWDDNGR